jgi:DnaJ-class molecular chaperone
MTEDFWRPHGKRQTPGTHVCRTCRGSGKIVGPTGTAQPVVTCWSCGGRGWTMQDRLWWKTGPRMELSCAKRG